MGEHDQLFKRACRVPANAAGELASVLPADVLAGIDLASLEAVAGDHVDGRLGERFADALFRARFAGAEGYVLFLLEHQSTVDPWMPLRVLEEMTRVWRELQRSEPERRSLPPVLCVVVHQGETPWTGPRRLQDLIKGASAANARFIPAFELVFDELLLQSDAALAARPLDPFPKLVLWALRDGRNAARLRDHQSSWTGALGGLATRSPEDMVTLLRYILASSGEDSFVRLREEVVRAVPASEDAMISIAEQFIQESMKRVAPAMEAKMRSELEPKVRAEVETKVRAEVETRVRAEVETKVRAEVRAEVQAETKAASRAEAVLAILEARGLTVSTEERARILACNLAALDGMLRVAVTCAQTDALFAR
jgi:hypothetical protein